MIDIPCKHGPGFGHSVSSWSDILVELGTVGWDMIAFSYCRGLRHGLSEEKRKRDRAKWSERLRGVGKARWKTYEDSSGEIGYACRLSLYVTAKIFWDSLYTYYFSFVWFFFIKLASIELWRKNSAKTLIHSHIWL